MKHFLLLCALASALAARSQAFWSETFGTGCNQLQLANGLNPTTNGSWTVSTTGTNQAQANEWYISATENGNAVGACGSGCGTNRTLHVGSVANSSGFSPCPTGDCGASYDAGGGFGSNTQTNKRVESPVINCTGHATITVSFKYIEKGQNALDDASLVYFDGSAWSTINAIAKTVNTGCAGQGKWTALSVALPATADNNPNVKIGFNWTNNNDGLGSDPSFAVDDVTLTAVAPPSPPVADFSTATTTICAGSCISFTDNSTNSPSSWAWSFPGAAVTTSTLQNPTGICYNTAGTYTVSLTATNASGSDTKTKVDYITVLAPPVISISPATPSVCPGATQTLTASGGNTYTWSPAAGLTGSNSANTTFTAGSTSSYTITGADLNGCSGTSTVTVFVFPAPAISISPASASVCPGATQTLTASGANTYTWNPATGLTNSTSATTTFTNTITGTYTVTGTDLNNCTATASITVTVFPAPVFTISPAGPSICEGATQLLTASGGNTYTWSPATDLTGSSGASTTFTGSSTSNYTVTATDANGCTGTASVIVNVTPTPTITVNPPNPTICAGTTQTLSASGATNYTWSPATGLTSSNTANTTFTDNVNSTYTVTGENSGCPSTATVAITISASLVISVSPPNPNVCMGSVQTLTASGAGSYTWSPAAGLTSSNGAITTFTGNASSAYTVTGSSAGCSGSTTVSVNVVPNPTINISPLSPAICAGSTQTLSASGANSYTWSPSTALSNSVSATTTSSAAATTTYTVSGADLNGCVATATVSLVVNPLPLVNATPHNASVCGGSTVTLNASGANTYTWSPATGLSSVNSASTSCSATVNTSYTVTGTDLNGCMDTSVVVVTTGTLVPGIVATSSAVCKGFPDFLSASGATSYTWQPAAGLNNPLSATPVATPSVTTTYTLIASNGACTGTNTVTVIVDPIPVASFTYVVPGGSPPATITFSNTSSGATTYYWDFSGNPPFSTTITNPTVAFQPGTYNVFLVAESPEGCKDTVVSTFTIADNDSSFIVMPNIFTPNEDGVNDVFKPMLNGIQTLSCTIFDRWGLKMYDFAKPNGFWDGRTTSGIACMEGVYFYVLEATGFDGKSYKLKGHLTLVR